MSEPLSPAVRAALAQIAEQAGAPVDDAVLRAWRAGSLSEIEHEAVAAAIAAHPDSRALLRALAAEPPRPEDRAWMAGMRATRGRRLARRAAWGAALIAAAAVTLLALRADFGRAYDLDGPYGGVAEARGDTAEPSRVFAPTGRLRAFARPRPGAPAAPQCVAFVAPRAGAPRRVPQRYLTLAPSGVCRVEVPVDQVAAAPGAYTLTLILGGASAPAARAPWPGWDAADAPLIETRFIVEAP